MIIEQGREEVVAAIKTVAEVWRRAGLHRAADILECELITDEKKRARRITEIRATKYE